MTNELLVTNRPVPTRLPLKPLARAAALAALTGCGAGSTIVMVTNEATGRYHCSPAEYALTAGCVAVFVGVRVAWRATDRNARLLTDQFGPRIAGLLNTRGKRAQAVDVFDLVARRDGDAVARAWMRGMIPPLGDGNPLLAIRDGRGADVVAAARSYASAENAN
ncbi:hypothetical protein ACH4VR_36090 [Streptomyces sp. NPDC020883]|uniref:hypothetical protein n=1 Tax=Streptomyces sp. NPDC020883 TaxID=3365099 RepID=UPI00379A7C96